MVIAVSACLLGDNCKYNGGNNYSEKVVAFCKDHEIVPICPEVMGGLPTPRISAEIVDGVEVCFLQSRSPGCGVNQIYAGSFSGTLISGSGIFASLAKEKGFRVIDVEDLDAMTTKPM